MSNFRFCAVVLCHLAIFAAPFNAFAQNNDCAEAQSTTEQKECAYQHLTAAEADMKLAFDHALALYLPRPEEKNETPVLPKYDREQETKWKKQTLRHLRMSQKAWLAYRESACEAVKDKYET